MVKLKPDFQATLYILAGCLLTTFPAFVNGYPLIYSDTSTYIHSAFEFLPPKDRPITYGLFIRLTSLNGLTMWTVIFAQTSILSGLLYCFTKKSMGSDRQNPGLRFALIIFVSSLAGAAWATSFLLPDIFTPIMVLAALLLLIYPEKEKRMIWLWIVFGLSAAMHSSHIPFGIALLSIILIARFIFPTALKAHIQIRTLLILIGLNLLAMGIMSSTLSKSKHVFQMGAYIEQGIIERFLKEECDDQNFGLCAYKDSLPDQAWQFIWEESLYQLGGWKATKTEFNEIIRTTWTRPRYLILHLEASFRETLKQIVSFKSVFVHGVSPNLDLLSARVEEYIPADINRFLSSRQNRGPLTAFAWLNPVQLSLVLLSLVLIPGLLLSKFSPLPNQKLVLAGILLGLGILIHAWVCGTFANPVSRLGSKMIWILPCFALILLLKADSKFKDSCLKSH